MKYLFVGASALLLLGLTACGGEESGGGQLGGETHWMRACDVDAECGSESACLCGRCTTECDDAASCGATPSAECVLHSLSVEICSGDLGTDSLGVCLEPCSDAATCVAALGDDFAICDREYCVLPDEQPISDQDVTPDQDVAPDQHVRPDLDVSPDADVSPDLPVVPMEGDACDSDLDCGELHCVGEACWDGSLGDLCDVPTQCDGVDVACNNGHCSPAGYAFIEGGTFTMGALESDPYRVAEIEQEHQVTLTSAYWLATHEVTQGDWSLLMGNNPSRFSTGDLECGLNCPVEKVNWWEALAYTNALSSAEGLDECYTLVNCTGDVGGEAEFLCTEASVNTSDGSPYACPGYRLAMEAEWEFACRAGTTTTWVCGADETCVDDIAWHLPNSDGTPHPVGQHPANPLGLYDMLGNVSEHGWDGVDTRPGFTPEDPATDPLGSPPHTIRSTRGGSFQQGPAWNRCAARAATTWHQRVDFTGIRVARSVP